MNRPGLLLPFSLIILVLTITRTSATTYTAIQSGNYTASGTWAGGIAPPYIINTNDSVIINPLITITLDTNITLINFGVIEIGNSSSIIDGTNPNYISLQYGNLKGGNCVIDIDSIYSSISFDNFTGTIKVEKFEDAGGITSNLNISIHKTLRILPSGGNSTSCTVNLNPTSRTTIIFSGGSIKYTNIDLSKPFNVRYEDADYDFKNDLSLAPEINSIGLTDIEFAFGNMSTNWFCLSDLTVKGKILFTSGYVTMSGSSLRLGGNATIGRGAGYLQFDNGKLVINSTHNNIGTYPAVIHVDTLEMNSPNPNATLYTGVIHIYGELRLISGKIAPIDSRIELGWPNNGRIIGGDSNSYIVTEYNGEIRVNFDSSYTSMTIPIGLQNTYAPVTASATYSLGSTNTAFSVTKGVYSSPSDTNSWNISSTKPVVAMTWLVYNLQAKNPELSVEWSTTMEANNFNRNQCYLAVNERNKWEANTISSASYNNGRYKIKGAMKESGVYIYYSVFDGKFVSSPNIDVPTRKQLIIYPNPSTDFIYVHSTLNAHHYEVINPVGNIVKLITNESVQDIQIDISGLPASNYYIIALNKDGRIIGKNTFVKQ